MHKQYSRLVQVKASKRLGSDQLESDNSHEQAFIRLVSDWNECSVLLTSPFFVVDISEIFLYRCRLIYWFSGINQISLLESLDYISIYLRADMAIYFQIYRRSTNMSTLEGLNEFHSRLQRGKIHKLLSCVMKSKYLIQTNQP